jgi:hypothetical protein
MRVARPGQDPQGAWIALLAAKRPKVWPISHNLVPILAILPSQTYVTPRGMDTHVFLAFLQTEKRQYTSYGECNVSIGTEKWPPRSREN